MQEKNNKHQKFIDLFCGAGGLSLGFEQAGFELFLANDHDKNSVKTYVLNRPSLSKNSVYCGDIEDFKNIYAKELSNSVDIIIGGPPCQGFSMANRQTIKNDPRNSLYKEFLDVVIRNKPRVVLIENVKGMMKVANQVVKDLNEVGYIADFRLLNARDYGVAQNRERLVYIGLRKDGAEEPAKKLDKIFNLIENKKRSSQIPLSDALWGLRHLKTKTNKNDTDSESTEHGFTKDVTNYPDGSVPNYILEINSGMLPNYIFNHKARFNNERDQKIYELLPIGGKSNHKSIKDIMPYKNRENIFKDKFFKLIPTMPSKTITSHMKFDCHMYIHPFESRALTAREAARIQSFPDNYEFTGPFTQWYHQVGNSVPPILARSIAESIKEIII